MKNWKLWLALALLIAWIVEAQREHLSEEGRAREAQTYNNAANIVAHDVCTEEQWIKITSACNQMAKDEKQKYWKSLGY